MFNNTQYETIQRLLREKAALKKENDALRAALNAPDIDFPNSEKGGQGEPGTPENSPESDLI